MANRQAKDSVVLLLPLSGTHEKLGKNILHAVIQSNKNDDLDVYVVDTSKFQDDLNADSFQNVKAVIGPVFFSEAHRFATIFSNVPILALSNNIKLNSGHIYACGLTPQAELITIFDYMKHNKINSIAVMLPRGKFFDELIEVMQKIAEMKEFDEDNISIVRYEKISQQDVDDFISNCGKDAVFMCEPMINFEKSSKSVFTMSSIALSDIKKWSGAKFAYADTDEQRNFIAKYEDIFHEQPTVISLIAADLIKAVNAALEENISLNDISFEGMLGSFSFKKDDGLKRQLHILTIKNGEKMEIEEAKDTDTELNND